MQRPSQYRKALFVCSRRQIGLFSLTCSKGRKLRESGNGIEDEEELSRGCDDDDELWLAPGDEPVAALG